MKIGALHFGKCNAPLWLNLMTSSSIRLPVFKKKPGVADCARNDSVEGGTAGMLFGR